MFIKIGLLIFGIMTLKGVMGLKELNKSSAENDLKLKEGMDTNGKESVYTAWLISALIVITFYLILFFNIGRMNEIMGWLSTIQIILVLKGFLNATIRLNNVYQGIPNKDYKIMRRIFIKIFDLGYISLAAYFLYVM